MQNLKSCIYQVVTVSRPKLLKDMESDVVWLMDTEKSSIGVVWPMDTEKKFNQLAGTLAM